MTTTTSIISSTLGTILLFAVVSKLIFRTSVAPFLIAVGSPKALARYLSWGTVIMEGILGLTLLTGVVPIEAAVVASTLLLAFLYVLLRARTLKVREHCNCFGALDSEETTTVSIVRTFLLASTAVVLTVAIINSGKGVNLTLHSLQATSQISIGVLLGLTFVGVFLLIEKIWWFENARPKIVPAIPQRNDSSQLT